MLIDVTRHGSHPERERPAVDQEELALVVKDEYADARMVGPNVARRIPRLTRGSADDLAVNVRQPEVAALILECQPFVIDAEDVQQRGVEIVNMYRILRDAVAEVVGFAMACTRP